MYLKSSNLLLLVVQHVQYSLEPIPIGLGKDTFLGGNQENDCLSMPDIVFWAVQLRYPLTTVLQMIMRQLGSLIENVSLIVVKLLN